MSFPIVVTHPSTLLHKGLHQLLAKSRFRPVRIATTLTDDLETYLTSLESAVWLTGIERSLAATSALVSKVVAANPRVKAVIMAASQEPEDIVAALKAGACGYLRQDIAGETLVKSLELIAHGEMIVHPLVTSEMTSGKRTSSGRLRRRHCLAAARSALSAEVRRRSMEVDSDIPPMSRREMLILHMLMQGASNKTIALTTGDHRVDSEGPHEIDPAKTAAAEPHSGRGLGAQSYR